MNRAFAEGVLGGRRVLGRRIRRVIRITARTGSPDEIQSGPWLRLGQLRTAAEVEREATRGLVDRTGKM